MTSEFYGCNRFPMSRTPITLIPLVGRCIDCYAGLKRQGINRDRKYTSHFAASFVSSQPNEMSSLFFSIPLATALMPALLLVLLWLAVLAWRRRHAHDVTPGIGSSTTVLDFTRFHLGNISSTEFRGLALALASSCPGVDAVGSLLSL